MAYTPTTWKDDIVDSEGNVVQQGTPVSASKMNKIEQAITAHDEKLESVTLGGTVVGNHQIFIELTDPTTITGYTVKANDIWFDLTDKVIKYYSSGWKIFGTGYIG
jgi:hypothetical protein